MLIDLITSLAYGADLPTTLLLALFSVVALLLVFPVHEFAHGLMAYAFGDKTAKYQGRLTLNPMDHIDLRGFLFLLIFGFGWAKPVQFDPRNFKNRRLATIMVAAAGPLSNILFGFLTFLIFAILSTVATSTWVYLFSHLFLYMAIYNISLAIFNLIPFPPLDGSKIVGELLPLKYRIKYYNLERYSFLFFIALIILMNRINIIGALTGGMLSLFAPVVNLIVGGIAG